MFRCETQHRTLSSFKLKKKNTLAPSENQTRSHPLYSERRDDLTASWLRIYFFKTLILGFIPNILLRDITFLSHIISFHAVRLGDDISFIYLRYTYMEKIEKCEGNRDDRELKWQHQYELAPAASRNYCSEVINVRRFSFCVSKIKKN